MKLHAELKKVLGYPARAKDSEIFADWKKRVRQTCKPCWELKYCPYGPLVEDFPLPPATRREDEEHRAMLESCLESGYLKSGKKLDPAKRKLFRAMLDVPRPTCRRRFIRLFKRLPVESMGISVQCFLSRNH